jgi:hypothetical protein
VQTHTPSPPTHIWNSSQYAAVIHGGHQLVRSDQKKMDELKRLREAMASGEPILTDRDKAEIAECTEILGVDGEL